MNNAAYEIVRKAKREEKGSESGKGGQKGGQAKGAKKTRYTEEPINHSSDAESVPDDDDEEVAAIFGFNMKMPLCLQV